MQQNEARRADDERTFVRHLNAQAQRYLCILEVLLSSRDQRFVFGTVRQSSRNPHTHFPGRYHTDGGCIVDIHVGKSAWESLQYDRSTWQVAHESVHLLDPIEQGSANFLEEGLATWFQNEPQFHDDSVKQYISRCNHIPHPEPYRTAKRLVVECQPAIIPAVKSIRLSGTALWDISVDILASNLPFADKGTVEKLCSRFE